MISHQTLTVFCPLGLSNRLRVLLSGLALAEAARRDFRMLWPLTPACAAPFAALFANPWPVESVEAAAVADLPYISGWFGRLPDLLASSDPDLIVGHPGWLIRPEQFSAHRPLFVRCQALLAGLQPASAIQQTIDAFCREHFRPTMIGVHLRRGDLLRQRPDVAGNTAPALHAADRFLERFPDAGILLCTDDGAVDQDKGQVRYEGVRDQFRRRYGSCVVWTTPRSLDRRAPAAIQDGLIDLWLLRQTDAFVGTAGSSFSEMAVFGRDIPSVFCAGATVGYQRLANILRAVGLYQPLQALARRRFDSDVPAPVLWRYYSRWPLRTVGRLIKWTSPALYRRLRPLKRT